MERGGRGESIIKEHNKIFTKAAKTLKGKEVAYTHT